ncbi:hypothetical protein PENTCL1PPCAC_23527 [Pristionchus entomophagus]|uniref:Uncharacterized protein n=1 Tax=Pristionchus entomophagus TaxID=358040 RepID=A0AAV5U3Z8_9BILA|nr:hypothetical protein PENTCL1PPCAC_23527 [Pristionchus entomophagus]
MTVDSLNTEAVSSRTKPTTPSFVPRSFAESVLSCPKCGEAMEPMLLGMNDDGSQTVWWTCSEVKSKKCTFPLDMPQDIFWITRSAQDIENDEVPPPNLSGLPIRYHHLYPSLFQYSRKANHGSRQGSHESTRSISSMESAGSSNGASSSIWDADEFSKTRTAAKLDNMRKSKVVMTQKKTYIPPASGNRARAFAESFRTENTASTSIASRLKLGRGEKTISAQCREAAKKKVIQMLSNMDYDKFKSVAPSLCGPKRSGSQLQDLKNAVIEHVKKRRAERDQLAELKRINDKRNKLVDIDDLVKAKLHKNKKEYEQRRLEQARMARAEAAKRSKMAGPSMPGYEEDDEEMGQGQQGGQAYHAPYAVTPPYMHGAMSPGPSTSSLGLDSTHFHHQQQEYDFGGADYSSVMDYSSSSGLDYSEDGPSSGEGGEETAGSPFTDLGPLVEGDLEGLEYDPQFDHAVAAFGDSFENDFADAFGDLAEFN